MELVVKAQINFIEYPEVSECNIVLKANGHVCACVLMCEVRVPAYFLKV
jgi:hypothetical protein